MSHQLTRDQHREVHQKHIAEAGGWASRQIIAEASWDGFPKHVQQALIATHQARLPIGPWTMTVEVCIRCGFTEHVTCNHSWLYWTHRPGCRLYDPATISVPEGLVQAWQEDTPDRPGDDCTGCLLLCPLCGADGT
jgi:hypothetical protein